MKATTLLHLLVVATVIVGLAGCAQPTPAPAQPPATQVAQPAATPVPSATPVPPTVEPTKAPVTVRYANWNLGTEEENNIQRQLIQKYMEENPHVTVELVDMSGEGSWDDKLTAFAAKGELPDVFMADKTPLYVKNGWLADLTDLVNEDPDWPDVPQAPKDGVTYSGKVLGLPAAQFVLGYFVNKDLYEAANLDAPEYGVSVDDFLTAVTSLQDTANGILGLDEMEFVLGWYPHTVDSDLKWFSFDGTHMHYNSQAFKEAMAKVGELKPYTWQGLTDEQKANFKSQGPWELFLNQEVGVRWDGGWMVPGYTTDATFEWDFMGIPGGGQALVMDIIVVSKTAANLEEAYNFARWMTFSKEAYAAEAELTKAMGSAPKMPVSVDDASIDLYKSFFDKPGVIAALQNLDNSLTESLSKTAPGYVDARYEGKPGIDIGADQDVNMWYMFNFANDGTFKYEDYAARLEEFANKILDEANAELPK